MRGPDRSATKIRAKRITLHYFTEPHPFRRWKLVLSIVAPILAAGWLVAYAARGDQRLYTSGPVSTAHAMFGMQCSGCHGPGAGTESAAGFFVKVSDRACTTCHAGPVHHESQSFLPACTSCHLEHKGRVELTSLSDRYCTQCHADLQTRDRTPPRFEGKIAALSSGHPEFAVAVKEGDQVRRVRLDQARDLRDSAQIKLNHQKHLKIGLKGVEDVRAVTGMTGLVEKKEGLALDCGYCHQTDPTRASMQPIAFAKHCVACHPLDFDARLPEAAAPHDRPALVHSYLRTLFTEAFEQCQALARAPVATEPAAAKRRKQCEDLELVKLPAEERPRGGRGRSGAGAEARAGEQPRGGRLGRRGEAEPSSESPPADSPRGARLGRGADAGAPKAEEAGSDQPRGRRLGRGEEATEQPSAKASTPPALEWAAAQLGAAEKLMFKQKCEFCHTMSFAPDRLPEVTPTAIPVRWLPYSRFDHGAHRPVGCAECHKATTSKETSDVLLPPAALCRECHRPTGGARTGCVECHLYHDKKKDRDLNGPFSIEQMATKR